MPVDDEDLTAEQIKERQEKYADDGVVGFPSGKLTPEQKEAVAEIERTRELTKGPDAEVVADPTPEEEDEEEEEEED